MKKAINFDEKDDVGDTAILWLSEPTKEHKTEIIQTLIMEKKIKPKGKDAELTCMAWDNLNKLKFLQNFFNKVYKWYYHLEKHNYITYLFKIYVQVFSLKKFISS